MTGLLAGGMLAALPTSLPAADTGPALSFSELVDREPAGESAPAGSIGLGDIFAERVRLDPETHLAWFRAEPWTLINPDHYIRRLCGELPRDAVGLDNYADCIEVMQYDFDHDFYAQLHPKAMERMETLKSLGYDVTSGNRWMSAYLDPHRVHDPAMVEDFFQTRVKEVRRDADNARQQARDRQARAEREAREEARRRAEAQARIRERDRQQKIAICVTMNANLANAYAHCARMHDAQGDPQAIREAERAIYADLSAQRAQQQAQQSQYQLDPPWKEQLEWQRRQRELEREELAAAAADRPRQTEQQRQYQAQLDQWRQQTAPARPAYEGFREQQPITISVPNAVALADLDKAGQVGGSTPVTIFPGGGAAAPGPVAGRGNSGGCGSGVSAPPVAGGAGQVDRRKRYLESLTFCRPHKTLADKWWCEGVTQKLFTAESLEEGLDSTGCKTVRKYVAFDGGRLYFCSDRRVDTTGNTGKATWNRDIARWLDIPASILADRREFLE